MMQRTIEVAHPGSHEPSQEQIKDALADVLKSEGMKQPASFDHTLRVNVSGGPSKVEVTFEEPAPRANRARPAKPKPTALDSATAEGGPSITDAAVTSPADNAANGE